MNRRRFLSLVAASTALPRAALSDLAPARWQGIAMGAEARLTLYGPGAEAALADAVAELRRLEALFSLYDPASALSRLNADGRLGTPDPAFSDLMQLCDTVHDATGGLFDPTIQPLWQALATGQDPAAARALVGWSRVTHDTTGIILAPNQALTLNGIAQGFITDRISALLAQAGFTRALVDMGEARALGGPFRLSLDDPDHGALGHLTLASRSIATSSPPALRLPGGETHILSPDGRPALWSTVSIEADSAALADGLSTAACLMTRVEIDRLARLPGLHRIRLVDPDGSLTSL